MEYKTDLPLPNTYYWTKGKVKVYGIKVGKVVPPIKVTVNIDYKSRWVKTNSKDNRLENTDKRFGMYDWKYHLFENEEDAIKDFNCKIDRTIKEIKNETIRINNRLNDYYHGIN